MVTKEGTAENDTLKGTKFADKLFGLEGKDVLKGLGGNDKLYGGDDHDKDTFVFGKNEGADTVYQFDVKKDVIEIAKGVNGIKTVKDIMALAKQKGDDVVINLGKGNSITIKDVTLKDLKKGNFDIG